MFIGHLALGFAAKRITPRVSLGMLLAATVWADALWPVLVGLGIEQVAIEPGNTRFTPLNFISYPYSHSLVALAGWGLMIGIAYRAIAGGRRTVWVLSALVVSHWLLDVVTHRPDMPLYPDGPTFGLGLWQSVPATMFVETAMYAGGLWVYAQTTRPRDAVGKWGFVGFASLLMFAYLANAFGGAPPTVDALWIAALVGVALLTALAWWIDRHRDLVASPR